MSEEPLDVTEDVTTPAEAEPAPTEQEVTPEPVNDDTATSTEDTQEAEPSRAEKRIQQLVGKAKNLEDFAKIAERERDLYKQQLDALQPQTPAAKPLVKPKMEDFDHDVELFMAANDAYYEQVIDQKVSTGINQGLDGFQKRTAKATLDANWNENVEKFAQDHPDYQEVAFATESIYDIIKGLQDGPDIAYHLGNNPAEAQRIGMLPKSQQAFELGKIQLSSPSKPAAKQKTTQAPEPPNPVGGQQPNDSIHNETMGDFMKRRNAADREKRKGRR